MNGFLLDTNIPSELIRTRPDPRVGNWVYACFLDCNTDPQGHEVQAKKAEGVP